MAAAVAERTADEVDASTRLQRAAPVLVAAAGALLFLLLRPRTVDLAAHVYRAELVDREGFAIWNGGWYGGHHTPAYSVLFPPLAALLGPLPVGALSAVAAAALFEPLARARFGARARLGTLWFGAATAALLFTGRMPFALGVAVGLGSLLALQRGRPALAAALAVACSLASPVAGLFLALAGVALAVAVAARGGTPRVRAAPGLGLAAAALLPPLALALAFPEGGREPFVLSAFLPVPLFGLACVVLAPPRERWLRAGGALYALAGIAAFAIDTPVGGNAARLGMLFGGPVLACAIAWDGSRARRAALAAAFAALAFWQLSPPVRDVADALSDPAAEASYHEPLNRFLAARAAGAPPFRVEVVFTHSHWEAAEVAPTVPLARGWQRQLDIERNELFYADGPLDPREYRAWLVENGVRYVALPDAELDYSAREERDVIASRPAWLRPVWQGEHWRVLEVVPRPPMASGARLERLGNDRFDLRFARRGQALVRVAWSPYWRAREGCVERAGDWTRVTARRAGTVRVTIDAAPGRLVSRGRRCG